MEIILHRQAGRKSFSLTGTSVNNYSDSSISNWRSGFYRAPVFLKIYYGVICNRWDDFKQRRNNPRQQEVINLHFFEIFILSLHQLHHKKVLPQDPKAYKNNKGFVMVS